MNFTFFDVEAANHKRDSICSIGIIRLENGEIIRKQSFLINPETSFDSFNISLHGITPEMVENAPTFPEVWAEIKPYFSDAVLVAHNARSMDLCALYRTLERYNLPSVDNDYICTYELARVILADDCDIQSYRLEYLCEKFGLDCSNHHDALCDTMMCMQLLRKFIQIASDKVVIKHYSYQPGSRCECDCFQHGAQYSSETLQMQKLYRLVEDILTDGIIDDCEIVQLQNWLEEHMNLRGVYPYDKIFELVEKIMEDGIMEANEQEQLSALLDSFINPQIENCSIDVSGKNICLSGDFEYGSKAKVEELLISRGANIVTTVTKKTDILILGCVGSANWKYGNYGSKYEKAQQLIEKGVKIHILKERDIIN